MIEHLSVLVFMSALLHLGCVSVLTLFASIRRQPLSQRQFDGQECGGTNALQCSVMRASEMGGRVRFLSSTKAVFELYRTCKSRARLAIAVGVGEHLGFS